ncbi:MAG: dipeptidase [Betaproteobacteria bacterium]
MPYQDDLTARAETLHRSAFVADGHADTIGRFYFVGGSLEAPAPGQHADLARLRQSGLGLQVMGLCSCWGKLPPGTRWAPAKATLDMIDLLYREVEDHPELRLVTDVAGLERLAEDRRNGGQEVGVVLAIEGAQALEGDLALLRVFYRLGVRLVTLTHNYRNELADGAYEESPGGLTSFGRQVVEEMNRLGMVIDVSHLAPPGFWEVLERSSAPVIASHSNARALCNHRRNLTDEQAKALAAKGGTIGVTFCPLFLREAPDDQHPVPTSLSDVLDQIDYLVDLAGPEHVALGSDFDGIDWVPAGLDDVSRLPALTRGLLERGHSEATIRGILGENLQRVFASVWR